MVDRSQLSRMIDNMEKYFDSMEARQKERHDAEDRKLEKECEYDIVNPLETPPNPPFSDSPPAQIHGQGKRSLF